MDEAEAVKHRVARRAVNWGFARVFGRAPKVAEAQVCQGVGWLETRYGTAWKKPPDKPPGYHPFNMGAIQCCQPERKGALLICPGLSFLYTDTHPNPDGSSSAYHVCFKGYVNDEDGFFDLARTVFLIFGREKVLRAAQSGSVWNCSAQLRDTGYYEGFGKNREERIGNHAKALGSAIARQCEALGEKPVEAFSIDEAAEEAALFGRVRMLVSLNMEYDADEVSRAAQRDLLEADILDAGGRIEAPRSILSKLKGLLRGE